jgi:hypothetical protein
MDYILLVDNEKKTLVEGHSPSVMKKVGEWLPRSGIESNCVCGHAENSFKSVCHFLSATTLVLK